ncbi:MAG: alpha/beta hydrolase [Geminicoccaceae bacterium]
MAAISVRPGASPIQLPHVELTLEQVEIAGMRVRLGHAVPRRGATHGTAVILTGRAEFIEKYRETVSDLIGRGFAVAIFDWRGQGGSDRFPGHGQRGHVPRIEDYLDDLAAVLGRLERLRLPQPWLMLAHSMGGHVGLRQLAREPGRFAGAALLAPMFGIRLPLLPRPLAQAICWVAIGMGAGPRYAPGQRDHDRALPSFARNKLTSCPEHFADYLRLVQTAPELTVGGVTYAWLAASLRSIALIHARGFPESITAPILVCQAGEERIVSNRAIIHLTGRLPRGRLLVFPGARHELLRERAAIRSRLLDAFSGFAQEIGSGFAQEIGSGAAQEAGVGFAREINPPA